MQRKKGNEPNTRLLKVGEVASLLAIHPNTVRRWAAQGLIKAWRVGPRGHRRFDPSDVQALLSSEAVHVGG